MAKVILITDTSSGIGKITARCLNENGYTVKYVIEDEKSSIATSVGAEVISFVPLGKELFDECFDVKIKETLFHTLNYL
jgi:NADP-dependent 3-hydroxy acid dehydrogenase YdfG